MGITVCKVYLNTRLKNNKKVDIKNHVRETKYFLIYRGNGGGHG